MEKIPLAVVSYTQYHPMKTKGGVQTFARNLQRVFADVVYMTPEERDIQHAVQHRLPVIADNQLVVHWPDGFPLIGFQHGVAEVKRHAAPSIYRWLMARAQKKSAKRPHTLWIANAEWVGETFGKLHGNGADFIIYNQTDTDRFDGKLDNESSRLILHDARTKHKGSKLMKHLQAAYPDWEIGLLDCPSSEVHNMMRRARAFIHLSTYEGNSLVCNEAMAMNLPCMFTRVGLMQDPHRPKDVFLVDPDEMFHDRRRLIDEFGKFLQTLDTRSYNPRAWTLENATLDMAIERWREAMTGFAAMSGWDLGTLG